MSMETTSAPVFAPWQQRVYDHAVEALDSGRMGHALLICGPAQLGQREVAKRLAHHLLDAGKKNPRTGQLLAAGTHPDYHHVSFILNKEGSKLRSEIIIDQIRELSGKLSLTPQYGGAQVAIVDPADAINYAACNALLKTLEEPQPGRFLWLLSANPVRLPATIRSRCQRLEFKLPPRDEALSWLQSQGHDERTASEALDAARGHPGLADGWLRDGGLALRREVASDLDKLAKGELAVIEAAQRWTADNQAPLRLRHAADLALVEAGGLTGSMRMRKLATWFDAANRTRQLLQTTVRADLAVAELLLAWRGNDGRDSTTQSRGRA